VTVVILLVVIGLIMAAYFTASSWLDRKERDALGSMPPEWIERWRRDHPEPPE
jgi:hypothetical protein